MPSPACDEQHIYVLAAGHLWMRGVEPVAPLPLRHESLCLGEGVLQSIRPAECNIEEGFAEIGPGGAVLAAKRRMMRIRGGDDQRVGSGDTRYENAGIARRDDDDLVPDSRLVEHAREIGWRERLLEPSRSDRKTVAVA